MKTTEQLFNEFKKIHDEQVKQGYEWSYGRWRHPNEPFYIERDSIPSLNNYFGNGEIPSETKQSTALTGNQ